MTLYHLIIFRLHLYRRIWRNNRNRLTFIDALVGFVCGLVVHNLLDITVFSRGQTGDTLRQDKRAATITDVVSISPADKEFFFANVIIQRERQSQMKAICKGTSPSTIGFDFWDKIHRSKESQQLFARTEHNKTKQRMRLAYCGSRARSDENSDESVMSKSLKYELGGNRFMLSRHYLPKGNRFKIVFAQHPLTWLSSRFVHQTATPDDETALGHLTRSKPSGVDAFMRNVLSDDDKYWRPTVDICRPCSTSYAMVIKAESVEDDVRMMTIIGFDHKTIRSLQLWPGDSNAGDPLRFDNLAMTDLMGQMNEKYSNDFTTFGYAIPCEDYY